MYTDMEPWREVRRRVLTGELSKRQACKKYELHWDTLTKILGHSEALMGKPLVDGAARCKLAELSNSATLPAYVKLLDTGRLVDAAALP